LTGSSSSFSKAISESLEWLIANLATTRAGHWGFSDMQHRARQIGSVLDISQQHVN
jgi:hypothetical protein